MTILESINRFTEYLKGNSHSLSTAESYRRTLLQFPHKNSPLEKLSPQYLQDFLKRFSSLTPSSKNCKRSAIKTFVKWALEMELLEKDISRSIKFEKIPMKEAKYFNEEEVKKFRQAIQGQGRNQVIFELFLQTGLRLSELRSLDVAMVRNKSSFMVVGKGNKSREVFLSDSLQKMLNDHCGKRKSGPLFLSSWKRRLCGGQISYDFKRFCKKAGVPVLSVHACRHSMLTMLWESTKNLRLVQEIAGHSSPQMTCRYAHIGREDKQRAIQNLFS